MSSEHRFRNLLMKFKVVNIFEYLYSPGKSGSNKKKQTLHFGSFVGQSRSPLSGEMTFNVFILLNGWICLHGVLD